MSGDTLYDTYDIYIFFFPSSNIINKAGNFRSPCILICLQTHDFYMSLLHVFFHLVFDRPFLLHLAFFSMCSGHFNHFADIFLDACVTLVVPFTCLTGEHVKLWADRHGVLNSVMPSNG